MSVSMHLLGQRLGRVDTPDGRPDWQQADPKQIEAALCHASSLPTGGWFVLDASRVLTERPRGYTVDGRKLVAWRARNGVTVGPASCPHMGADLTAGCTVRGRLVCPWHGLSLGPEGHGNWQPLPTYDDGVLLWVRLPNSEQPTDKPFLTTRPREFAAGVIRVDAQCDPIDVIANRLDPWHGTHFHPHSFVALRVLDARPERLRLRVAVRAFGPFAVEVEAAFACVDARTIVMTIERGEGQGSVVETHATPIGPGRTAIIEATLATSGRPLVRRLFRLGAAVRPLIEQRARRLWVEDAAYAERRYALRKEIGSADTADETRETHLAHKKLNKHMAAH